MMMMMMIVGQAHCLWSELAVPRDAAVGPEVRLYNVDKQSQ